LDNQDGNSLDDLLIDIRGLYEKFPVAEKKTPRINFVPQARSLYHSFYRCSLLPLGWRKKFYALARRTSFDITWFAEFKTYWTSVLDARPLWGVHDLYFLKNNYRIKFQRSNVSDTADPLVHLDAWQRPELIYQLLHLVTKEVLVHYADTVKLALCFNPKARIFLEFGCATAPLTMSFFEFFKPARTSLFYMSDIQTLAFHYGAFRFRRCENVMPLLLHPENGFRLMLNKKTDVIFCLAVFEHLNSPLETVREFLQSLNKGGILVFDYIKSEGGGLDTAHGVRQRGDVLKFIGENFNVLYGRLTPETSMGLTIVRKR